MSITIKLLLSILTIIPTSTEVPDLCDVVNALGVPVICELHPDGAPVYNGNVCCTEDTCVPAGTQCKSGALYHCDLGERHIDGQVSCYVEVPSYCQAHACAPGFQAPPLEEAMCCSQGICWPTVTGSNDCEIQDIFWCDSGVCNPDGTITCLDDE